MDAPASSRFLILACSATKRDGQACMPVIERYHGPLWRSLRAVDPRGEKAKIAFLSARLGFREASMPMGVYWKAMSDTFLAPGGVDESEPAGGSRSRLPFGTRC